MAYPSQSMCVNATSFTGAGGSAPKGMALAIAKADGFDATAVTIVTPYAGDVNRIQVSIAQPVATTLLSLIGFSSFNISGRAVATVQSGVVSQALLVLNPTMCGAADLSGDASISIRNGGLQVNSNCATAFKATGNATVDVQAAAIRVVGNYTTSGNATLNPVPQTGAAPLPDPLASLSPPTGAGLPTQAAVNCAGSSTMSIVPGIYPSIAASSSCSLTMQPGVYILTGGGLSISGNATLIAHNVFVYNAGSSFPSVGGSFGAISLGGTGTVDMTPQTTGPYAGLLVFQSRDNNKPLTVSGNLAVMRVQGTVYGPAMKADISGQNTIPAQIIVDSLKITGQGSLQAEYTPSQVYGVPSTSLVE
jgi:hypothetical protein